MLVNIGHVTETLKRLIQAELTVNGATLFGVTAQPPDSAAILGTRTVSVYLFHVVESPDLKNLPSKFGGGPVPVRHEPMGLILQYIVTIVAQDDSDVTDTETIEQQRLIGFVARAIHDYPVVSDSTQILVPGDLDPTLILFGELRGTGAVLRFNLRPAPMEETIAFWAAEDKNAPRLSLFIEARVVVLEPKPAEVAPGIVLSVGQFIFPSAEPQLAATRNTTFFLPPNATGARSVRPSPARVAVFDAPGSQSLIDLAARDPNLLENNRLAIEAVGLGPGERVLVLRSPNATIRVALDQPPGSVPLLNQHWQFSTTATSVTMGVFHQVVDTEGAIRAISPGVYGVRVIVMDPRAGLPRPRSSNELAFTIVPQILSVGPSEGALQGENRYTLTLVTPSFRLGSEVSLSVGGRVLTPTEDPPEDPPDPPGLGKYRILFAFPPPAPPAEPPPVVSLEFQLPLIDPANPAGGVIIPSPTNPLALRLVIDGATANPDWLTEVAPP